jgi:RES domain
MVLKAISTSRIRLISAHRIIASRYPPIDLFERVNSDPKVWDALTALEMATNPRLRDEVGEISMVPIARRVFGSGASYVMAPFTHTNPKGSRFSDGTFGVYYAASDFGTAVAEVAFHFARFAQDSGDGQRYEEMRCLVGEVDHDFVDVNKLPLEDQSAILDPISYIDSQAFGGYLKFAEYSGVYYPSVRRQGGHCVGSFYPDSVGIPKQANHIKFHYDGNRVRRYFDFQKQRWIEL